MVTTPSTKVRDAAKFILEERAEKPSRSLHELLDEAGMRFNLAPLDSEALTRILADDRKTCLNQNGDVQNEDAPK